MFAEIPPEQFAAALDDCAREVLAEGRVERPPVDAFDLAERLDFVVARDSAMEVRARFVRLGNGVRRGTILMADDPRPERRHWAVAHEIGESVAHRVFALLGVALADLPATARERVANHLASCLLLPRDWFAADGRTVDWDLWELKQIYRTASHELIARRMLEMPPPVIVTLFDQGRLQWRRSNALRRPPPLTPAETACWRLAWEQGQPTSCTDEDLPEEVEGVRSWPVHEPGWRREILRTALRLW